MPYGPGTYGKKRGRPSKKKSRKKKKKKKKKKESIPSEMFDEEKNIMNNLEQLIGESIWNTYANMAYLVVERGAAGLMRRELALAKKSGGRKGLADPGVQTRVDLIKQGRYTKAQRQRGSPMRTASTMPGTAARAEGESRDRYIQAARRKLEVAPVGRLAAKEPGGIARLAALGQETKRQRELQKRYPKKPNPT